MSSRGTPLSPSGAGGKPSSSASPSGATTVIKVRAGGSGQSSLALKLAAEKPPSNGRGPLMKQPAAAPGPAQPKPAVPTQQPAGAVPTKHKIVIAARESSPAVGSTAKAAPTKPGAASTPPGVAQPTSSSSSSTVSPPSAAASTSSSNSATRPAPRSTYVSPASYSYPSSPASATTTPNGIVLDLSGKNAAPQLVATKSRSDRLREACTNEDKPEVVNLLGQGTDPNQADAYGNTALMLAASTGNADIVDELLSHGASVHAKDKYGQTPLVFACSKAHFEVAKMLVERKAGVNVQTMHGQTALMKVCYISHPHTGILAELLLTNHARPDLQTSDGTTAAMIAAQNDHMELLEILAHYGAKLDLQRKSDGATPLHLAAEKASFTMVANLIAMGAKTDVKDAKGRTFLEVAPLAPSGGGSDADFRRKLGKAHERGLALREERAAERAENEAILARVRAEKVERMRAELIESKLKEGRTLTQAHAEATEALGTKEGERKVYVDDEGQERVASRPESPGLTYAELKARTYKPKIDARSVFSDDEPTPEPTHGTAAAPISTFNPSGAPSYSASAYPASYNAALNDDDDDEDEMKMTSSGGGGY